MRAIGVALDKNTLQQVAYANGINMSVDAMTRAQKTELIYYQIMTSTQKMQGALAKSAISPQVAFMQLKNEFLQLARAVGSVFIPAIMAVIPVIRAVTQILTEAAQWLAGLFGFKIENYTANMDSMGVSIGGIADNLDDVGGSARKATRELQKMLMPFDELNNVNFETGSSGGSGGGSGIGGVGGSLGLPLPEYDMFAGLDKNINSSVENIKRKIKELKPLFLTLAGIVASIWAIDKITKFVEWINRVGKAFDALGIVGGALRGLIGLAFEIGGAFLIYKGIKHAIDNGFDWKSLLMIVGGADLMLIGAAIQLKSAIPLKLGLTISLMAVSGWFIYNGIKHAIEEGLDAESLMQIIGGTFGMVTTIAGLGKGFLLGKGINVGVPVTTSLVQQGAANVVGGAAGSATTAAAGGTIAGAVGTATVAGLAAADVGLGAAMAEAGKQNSYEQSAKLLEKKAEKGWEETFTAADIGQITMNSIGQGAVKAWAGWSGKNEKQWVDSLPKIIKDPAMLVGGIETAKFDMWSNAASAVSDFFTPVKEVTRKGAFTDWRQNSQNFLQKRGLTGQSEEDKYLGASEFLKQDNAISKGIDNLVTKIEGLGKAWKDLPTTIKGAVDKIKEKVPKIFTGIKDKVLPTVTTIKDNVVSKFGLLKDGVISKIKSTDSEGTSVFSTIKNSFTGKSEETKNSVVSKFEETKNGILGKLGLTKTEGSTALEEAKNLFMAKASETKDGTVNAYKLLKDNSVKELIKLRDDGSITAEEFRAKLKAKMEAIPNENLSPLDKLKRGVLSTLNDTSSSAGSKMDEIKRKLNFSGFHWQLPSLKLPHFSWSSITNTVSSGIKGILSKLSLPISLPKLNVSWWAEGGFPNAGELFIANEAGPELIGNIGRRTAVANQNQITEGIANATYNAFTRALQENGGGNNGDNYFEVNVGDERIYSGYATRRDRDSKRYGVQT